MTKIIAVEFGNYSKSIMTIRTIFLLVVCALGTINFYAQYGSPIWITTQADEPQAARLADLNGDGHLDAISISSGDNKVAWYENMDGLGSFGPQQIIATEGLNLTSVQAVDIDSDGDLDIIWTAWHNSIAWNENIDGQGNFGAFQLVYDFPDPVVNSAYGGDVDSDGDTDLVVGNSVSNLVWFDNLDGLGNFGPPISISTNVQLLTDVFLSDLDDDGDNDLITASSDDNTIAWYENQDGLGSFSAPIIITSSAATAKAVYIADIDGDGDPDVLSASSTDDKIAWYENLDGFGDFGPERVITTDAVLAWDVFAEDLDNDGDMDVLSASRGDDTIAWYENIDGVGDFSLKHVIFSYADSASSVHAGDINADGNLDIISASTIDDRVAWYEYGGVLGVKDNLLDQFAITPNPANAIISIKSDNSIKQIQIYDINFRLMLSNRNSNKIDISVLSSGVYLVLIESEFDVLRIEKLIKK
ncbi:MAG: T9SS C-terminal target domain-containing protein [Flavobacterium sp.]|nr:MAG: T9SS C-terminal target domain-containing protein [Flavobacterium sp.]